MDYQKENPETVAAEIGVCDGIEALPKRLHRYGIAKKSALNSAEYMLKLPDAQRHQKVLNRVVTCGDYLLFRHYYTVDETRLHAASLCKAHLLCQLCAIRRGAKALAAYLQRFETIRAAKPSLKAFMVTLTLKHGDDLGERFKSLQKAVRELWMRRARGRGSWLDPVQGAVWSYECKKGKNSGQWNCHLHMIALSSQNLAAYPSQQELSRTWHNITGDSKIVDVRPIDQDNPVDGFLEVFKYATKFSDMQPEELLSAYNVLKGRRLLASAGCFRNVDVPESLLDEPLDGLPYVEYFYQFAGEAYSYCPTIPQTVKDRDLKKPKMRTYTSAAPTCFPSRIREHSDSSGHVTEI